MPVDKKLRQAVDQISLRFERQEINRAQIIEELAPIVFALDKKNVTLSFFYAESVLSKGLGPFSQVQQWIEYQIPNRKVAEAFRDMLRVYTNDNLKLALEEKGIGSFGHSIDKFYEDAKESYYPKSTPELNELKKILTSNSFVDSQGQRFFDHGSSWRKEHLTVKSMKEIEERHNQFIEGVAALLSKMLRQEVPYEDRVGVLREAIGIFKAENSMLYNIFCEQDEFEHDLIFQGYGIEMSLYDLLCQYKQDHPEYAHIDFPEYPASTEAEEQPALPSEPKTPPTPRAPRR